MTSPAPVANLSAFDLPPPPPHQDPREPDPATVRRGARTPSKAQSPSTSRAASPTRPGMMPRSLSSDGQQQASSTSGNLPIRQPSPRIIGGSTSPRHLSPASVGGNASPSAGGLIQPVPLMAVGSGGTAAGLQPQPSFGSLGHVGGAASPPSVPLAHHISRPSSPASIHSSTSAIFERDIELPAVQALSLQPSASPTPHTLNHKPSRLGHLSHGSTLDHTVPAVLDDAVEALAAADTGTSRGLQGLEIEAPAPIPNNNLSGIAMARQSSASLAGIQRKGSGLTAAFATPANAAMASPPRSPSPASGVSRSSSMTPGSPPIVSPLGQLGQLARAGHGGSAASTSIIDKDAHSPSNPFSTLGSSATGGAPAETADTLAPLSGTSPAAAVTRPPMHERLSTGPQLPGGWWSSFNQDKEDGSVAPVQPVKEDVESGATGTKAPLPADLAAANPSQAAVTPVSALPAHLSPSKQPSARRISFLSPTDLLLSVPTQVTPLREITSGHLSPEHLPGTISPSMPAARSPVVPTAPHLGGVMGHEFAGTASSAGATPTSGTSPTNSTTAVPLVGKDSSAALRGPAAAGADGEWAREGLGKGLEQRLEDLAQGQGGR